MKTGFLLIALSLASLCGYSQITIGSELLSEINTRLIDGLEYNALLQNAAEKLNYADSINLAQGKIIDNLTETSKILEDNIWHFSEQNANCLGRLSVLLTENEKYKRKTRTYRTLAIIGGVISIGGAGILILK